MHFMITTESVIIPNPSIFSLFYFGPTSQKMDMHFVAFTYCGAFTRYESNVYSSATFINFEIAKNNVELNV